MKNKGGNIVDTLKRGRRLRTNETMRRMVRETAISVSDLIYPMFLVEGENVKEEISSMPGVYRYSQDLFLQELGIISMLKIPGVLLFGVPKEKDEFGKGAYDPNGIVQSAIREAKRIYPEILMIADICLCEYTSHGHCGVVENGRILNDESVELIAKSALSCAQAGADIVAPSDMMDGRIVAIRNSLDEAGYIDTAIMSYSAKFASACYGPFREAACSAPSFGDRKTYQMDYCNFEEAMREVESDIDEGADFIMIKPAMLYLDIVKAVKDSFNIPIVVYNVSGEYAMIKAAAMNGWIDEKKVVMESITAMKRAGAKIIITYFAIDIAKWLKEEI